MRPVVVAAAALLAVLGLAGCSAAPDGAAPSASASRPANLPTGTTGAAHFDTGYLQVGTGSTVVDVYFDPMCPVCGAFEHANGPMLAALAGKDAIALRLHPMTFLNRFSNGTEYSTRADAALTCVAAAQPEKTLDYLAALYADQPEENSDGHTNAQLADLAVKTGADPIGHCLDSGKYQPWAQYANDEALAAGINGTPTVFVNGSEWPLTQKALHDATELGQFIGQQAQKGSAG